MVPTISSAGDLLFVDKWTPHFGKLVVGDVILTTNPYDPAVCLCKRVIGMGGDTVMRHTTEVVVPIGHIWLEGDNKEFSMDSRAFGAVSEGLVQGKVLYKIWPKVEKIS